MTEYINVNGKVLSRDKISISPDNRSFRYGDGFFETMKFSGGKILLANYHFERLFASLETLEFDTLKPLTADIIYEQVTILALKNNHSLARVRMTFYRGDGGLYDDFSNKPNYLIQTWNLNPASNHLNENGLVVDFYKDARKTVDRFSSIKSNNFLPYVMGAIYAKKNRLNDCIIMNAYGHVADATIANVFTVNNGVIRTPPLTDGTVNGVMRRFIIRCIKEEGMPFLETSLSEEDILQASEIFLTNAIYGLRWVKQVGTSSYQNQLALFLHKKFLKPLFAGSTF